MVFVDCAQNGSVQWTWCYVQYIQNTYILSALYTCQEFLEAIQLHGIIMLLHIMLCDIIIYKHCCDHLHENHSATLVGHLGRG